MKKINIWKPIMLLTLLFGVMPTALAEDRFYIDAVNIEPGETKTLAFNLDNSQTFYGFQSDITLPEGIEIVMNGSKPDITLSSRTDASYTIVANLLSSGAVRLGTFSTSHTPISGNSGALLYLKVSADDSFVGGTISLTDILFIDANDRDVQLPDFSIDLGTVHNNNFYIPDFKIAVGETKTVSIILDNETPFTAFQTDIYLPEGLIIEANSFVLSFRATGTHSVSAKSFSDGRTRIACLSTGNDVFTGNNGELLSFNIAANKDVAETCQIELKNQIFSMANAKEYIVPNSITNATTERALVESVTLNKRSLSLIVGESELLTVNVLPTFASTKDVDWSSESPEIATVSTNGLVTAVGIGTTTIKVEAVDGSDKFDECTVTVSGIPVTGITLSQTSASLKETETLTLTATASPANATDKSVTWESLNPDFATVDANTGIVTAQKVGEATIVAKSISNPEVTAQCMITVTPLPVSEIILNQNTVSIEVGSSFEFTYSVLPEAATNTDVTWSIEPQTIASVSDEGKVTGLALGTAYLTAIAADGFGTKAMATVNVVPTLATGIVITEPTSKEFKVGETIQLSATVSPENAWDKSVSWSSDKIDIATVNSTGLVTAVSEGQVVITATNSSGNTDEITLTVIPTLAESISVLPESVTLRVGGEATLIAAVLPATTTNKEVTWTASAPDIANVDDSGKVTAYQVGESIITVTTTDGSQRSAECKVTVEPTPATDIQIQYDGSTTLQVGDKVTLSAKVLPDDATDKSFTWKTQTGDILTVTPEGVVEAIGLGTAWVGAFATGDYPYATIEFTIVPTPVSNIEIEKGTDLCYAGETIQLTAKVSPSTATNQVVEWSTSNPSVATVNANGLVTAIYAGEADITAKATDGSDVSASTRIYVAVTPVDHIEVSAAGFTTLKASQTVQLSAKVFPETATDKNVVWRSSSDDIATVDAFGLVTAVNVGQTSITASSGGQSASIDITVEKTLAESISLNRSTASLKVAGTILLSAQFTPETTTDKSLKWESSDPQTATVSESGLVTAHALGNCRITATTQDGSEATAYCEISVVETAAESVKITPEGPFTLNYGDEIQFTATVYPETATDKSITWQSQTDGVIINQRGLAKAVAAVKDNWIQATNSAGQTDYVYITVLPIKVSSIELTQTSSELKVNEELKLSATVIPDYATDKNFSWNSTSPAVASVDVYGNVRALSIGETDIEATANDGSGVKAVCHVSVVATPVERVDISTGGSTTLKAGNIVQLYATIYPADATIQTVEWSSENEAIASVNEYGLVTANAVGSVDIIASAGGKEDRITITVEPTLIESLTLTNTRLNMEVGDDFQLTVWISPSNATNQTLKWTSQNLEIASVDDNGKVTANTLGETVVEVAATDGSGATASIPVWVNPTPISRIVIDYEGITTIKVGDKIQFNVNIYPENATDKSYYWEVSDTDVLSISETGLLEAVGLGEAWVGVFATGGNPYDIITFEVVGTPVERIDIEKDTDWCYAGETIQLTAKVYPETATNSYVEWSSSDESILTVDQNGLVTAHYVGQADITTRATDGSGVSSTTTIYVAITPVDHIEITALGNTILKDGKTVQLVASVYPSTATHQSISWTSDNEQIATVSNTGLVTAGNVLGETIVRASTEDGSSATISITVEETPIESMFLSVDKHEIHPGDIITLTAEIFPDNATYRSVNWSWEDKTVIGINTVAETYLVCQAQEPGVTTITATTDNGISSSMEIWVDPILVNEIILNPVPQKITVGESVHLNVTVLPENATNKTLTWVYDSEKISINDDYVMLGLKAGTAEVTVYSADGMASFGFTVEVIQHVTSISLNEHDLILEPSSNFELVATIEPIDASNKSVSWNSTNTSVADVDDFGVISTKEEGNALITVSTLDGSALSDECRIKVQKQVVDGVDVISIDDFNITISDANIQIKDLSVGTKVYLFGVDGILYYSANSNGETLTLDINRSQFYILKIGNYSLKVAPK